MTPILISELPSTQIAGAGAASTSDGEVETNIIGALLEALNAPDRYRLSERGGELFIEPAETASPVAEAPAGEDARACDNCHHRLAGLCPLRAPPH